MNEDVFDLLPTPCVVSDLNGVIKRANASLAALTGKSPGLLVNTHLDKLLSLASQVFMQTHVWPLLRKELLISEIFLKITDGEGVSQPVMADCVVRNIGEQTFCYWLFFVAQERNKFERKLIEARQEVESINAELNQSQKALKLANNELEKFSYSVSHDLRAPLISISGFTKQLQSELSDSLTERQLHRFERIASNVNRMRCLMDDLLQLSKITLQDIQLETISLQTLVEEQLGLVEKSLTDVDATVYIDTPLPEVLTNKVLLGQCVANLLTNAIAYREPSRQLVIRIIAERIADEIELRVTDNGIGICEADQQKIFNMFEHLSPAKGTGIGLAIVKAAVEKVNGGISVTSSLGKGSTFSLRLPLP